MKKKQPNVELLHLGQWIRFVIPSEDSDTKLGQIVEITGDGRLKIKDRKGYSYTCSPSRVVKAYPFFTVLPIPGKLEE